MVPNVQKLEEASGCCQYAGGSDWSRKVRPQRGSGMISHASSAFNIQKGRCQTGV